MVGEEINRHGLGPGKQTGKYSRHCKNIFYLPKASTSQYALQVPGYCKYELSRQKQTLAVAPIHEIVHKLVADEPSIPAQLQTLYDSSKLPPNYYTSPLVRERQPLPLPLRVYMDAAPYSLTDSCLGIWIECLVSNRRFCIALIRKRRVCQCGCRGWCTYWQILDWIHYCFKALAEQRWPMRRHDGSDWLPQDCIRSSQAGSLLNMSGALIQLRGDWSEFCERLGYPTWKSSRRPCLSCACDHGNWWDLSGCTPLGLPWHCNSHEDVDLACSRCEVWVTLDEEQVRQVRAALKYDKRKAGNLGRCLRRDFKLLGLEQGDRLESNPSLRDTGDFGSIPFAPGEHRKPFLFWRRSMESVCMRRCPLWDSTLGITAERILAYDILHTIHLGVMAGYVHCSLWQLLSCNAWQSAEALNAEETLKVQVMHLRAELFSWYKTHKVEELTRLSDLTVSMLGPGDKKTKAKGAETYGLLVYLVWALKEHAGAIGANAAHLIGAGHAIKKYLEVCRKSQVQMPIDAQQDTIDYNHLERKMQKTASLNMKDNNQKYTCEATLNVLMFRFCV